MLVPFAVVPRLLVTRKSNLNGLWNAGGAFALFSLLKRQAGLGAGGRTAALDRMLTQYSTGPARSGSSAASLRTLRQRASSNPGQGSVQGSGKGLGVPQGSSTAARLGPGGIAAGQHTGGAHRHDWRQRLIAVRAPCSRRCMCSGCTCAELVHATLIV